MFASQGYDATSVRDIAARVGIRGASMYHHFSSKEEILWDLTHTALIGLAESWRLGRAAADSDDPEALLRAFVRSGVSFHARNRTEATLVNSQLRRLATPHFDQAVEMRRLYEQELTTIVQDCVGTGRYAVPDVRVAVFAILQMTVAISGWFEPAGRLSVDELAAVYEELAVKMLAAA